MLARSGFFAAFAIACSVEACSSADSSSDARTTSSDASAAVTSSSASGGGGSGGAGGARAASDAADLGKGMPQVLLQNPGQTLTAPKVVAITYDGDPNRADIDAFLLQYGMSSVWKGQMAEYGIGPLGVSPPQHLAGPAPASITDDGLTALLDQNLGGANPAWGKPDPSTIYTFFLPKGTVVDSGGLCCNAFDGYHSDYVVGSTDVPYAVACQCDGFDGPGISPIDQLTIVAAHELIEAASDPFPTYPGYGVTDDAHAAWTIATEGELGDMCQYASTAYWKPEGMDYMVQRTWSNEAAAAGHDPCVGSPNSVYYQAIPETPDAIHVSYDGAWATRGTKIALGSTGTVTLDVLSDGATGPLEVTVLDYNSALLGGTKLLDITTSAGPVQNGDQVTATIQVLAADPSLKGELFVVQTKPVDSSLPPTYYFGLIGQH